MSFYHDSIGREVLKEEVDDPNRTLVTLVWDHEDVTGVYSSLFQNGNTNKYIDLPASLYPRVQTDKVLKTMNL